MKEYRNVVLTDPALKKIPVPMVPPIAAQIAESVNDMPLETKCFSV